MTPEILSLFTIISSIGIAIVANYVAVQRMRAQNRSDEGNAAESVSDAAITLIMPLRNELGATQKELALTREQLKTVQTQLDETMAALRATKNDVLMSQSEIRLLTTQNSALLLRVTELESENRRLHKQIDGQ